MKTVTLVAAAASLLQLTAAAHPFRNRRHGHQHEKKDVVVTVTDIVYDTSPEVIVYVDQFGSVRSSLTNSVPAYTTVSASSSIGSTSSASPSSSFIAATTSSALSPSVESRVTSSISTPSSTYSPTAASTSSTSVYVAPVPTTTSVAPIATTSPAAPVATASSAAEAGGYGFSYTPYKADGTCKSQSDITADFANIDSSYSMVRIYGTDCNQAATILSAAQAKGLKIFAGIYYLATLSDEIQLLVDAAKNGSGWSSFDTIAIGNELVNSGEATAAEVVAALSTARTLLTTAGYTGHIVTVDTLVAARANPELCDKSDYCAVNCHPFFDDNTSSSEAGSFISAQIKTLQAVLSDSSQQIVITETGWPWKGNSHGSASVSLSDQAQAIASIKSEVSVKTILLSAYNDLWKVAAAATYDAEQYWGIGGATAPSDG